MRVVTMILIILSLMGCSSEEKSVEQDWPNLKYYKSKNLELGSPKKDEKRVVFMGNSITEGWSTLQPEFFEGKSYINRGISGQTTPQMLLRYNDDVINLKPYAVIILAGTNDLAGNTGPTTIKEIFDNFCRFSVELYISVTMKFINSERKLCFAF